ncbi:uncharacterized protein LOC130560093 [Triplophysa rosa]|uniref:uncharacterized protein LOC130560093 n=1 Tax=Triplophysa rosa TaxID=992332 RepID=UPI00254625A6|nr:uncharacterized protein LOC130560093 [Triplophysa rosa]
MFFSLRDEDTPLGVDALAHLWPRVLLYAFPPLCLILPIQARVRGQNLSLILIAPRWPKAPWMAEISPLLYAQPWPLPLRTDLLVPGEQRNLPPPPGQGGSLGLARERANLNTFGLPARVITTIQNARAASTRSLYDCNWHMFEEWCDGRRLISYQCSVADILCFLQDLINKGRSFSTIKVYLAAIAVCHVGFDGTSVGQHPLLRRFMKSARRFLPTPAKTVPEWDLSMVLESLSRLPFEPLGDVSLKHLSFKTALLLALTSAK